MVMTRAQLIRFRRGLRFKRVRIVAVELQLSGDRGVINLTLIVAYYSALTLAQVALKLEMEPGQESISSGRLAGQKPLAHEQDLRLLQRRVWRWKN